MTGLACRWFSKGLEAISMRVITGMASGTGPLGRFFTPLRSVAFVAIHFAMSPTEIKLRACQVIEGVLLKRTMFGGVTPIATLDVKEHVLVGGLMASRVAAIARFGAFEIEERLGMAFGTSYIFVRPLLGKLCMAFLVVIKVESSLLWFP